MLMYVSGWDTVMRAGYDADVCEWMRRRGEEGREEGE